MAREVMIKRSLTIRGHRTSVSLESRFWACLRVLAARRGVSVSGLVAEIDDRRTQALIRGEAAGGLSSMLRLYILEAALLGELHASELKD